MNFKQQRISRRQISLIALLLIGFLLFGQATAQTTAPAKLSAAENNLAEKISVGTIKEITVALAAPEMQGRGTMQLGGDKAANYIAERLQKLGLKPLGDKGTFLQKIDFKETVFTSETMFKVGDEPYKFGSDYAFIPFSNEDQSASGEMVFIAYGIQAKSINRDDLDGIDVRGKIVVVLDGPPANIPKEAWEKNNAKFAILGSLIKNGVAGIVVLPHGREKDSNEMVIDYLSRRQISMIGEQSQSFPIPPLVMASGRAAENFSPNPAQLSKTRSNKPKKTASNRLNSINQPESLKNRSRQKARAATSSAISKARTRP